MDDEPQKPQQSPPQQDPDLQADAPDPERDERDEPDAPDALYRKQAYEQRGRVAPIDGVLRVSLPHEWLLLAVLAAVVVGVLVWSVVGRLESGVSGPCTLHASGARHPVVAPVAGVVVEVLAEPAGEVAAGYPLARLSVPELSLAAELAAARAAALEAQHPGAPETLAAAAEAEALAGIDKAGTMVLSPATGLLAASELLAGASVEAGAVVAEVQHVDAGPPSVAVSLGDEESRIRTGMKTSIALTAAGASRPVIADGFVAAVGATAAAELVDPPPEFTAAAALSGSGYECSARIITGSYRPINRLLGRS